mgnify:CR=1 FL=1
MTITGRTVLFGMIAFFGVIFAVNGVFLYLALDTFPGLTSNRAYVEGLNYNQTLEDGRRQAALGWKLDVSLPADAGGEKELLVRLRDDAGQDIPYLAVRARLERPATASGARDLDLIPSATGHRVGLAGVAPGRWQLQILATREGQPVYRMTEEVFVRP